MKTVIVYSSATGNTARLAQELSAQLNLPAMPLAEAEGWQDADRILAGFWTDKGSCDEALAAFLATVEHKEVFLFGTAGFGSQPAYFQAVLKRVQANLGQGCTLVGSYMCQGKMPQAVRRRYEAMLAAPDHAPNLEAMIENFDHALSHPDTADLDGLAKAVLAAGRE